MKRGLDAFAKNTDPCNAAQSSQTDMNRYLSLSVSFLQLKGLLCLQLNLYNWLASR